MRKNITNNVVSIVIVACIGMFSLWTNPLFQPDEHQIITIDFDVPNRSAKSMVGFLHSFNDTFPTQKLIDELSPKVWRLGGGHLTATYRNSSLQYIRGRKISPIILCSDYYYPQKNISQSLRLTQFEQVIETIYSRYQNNVIYDLWNEPNHPSFWQGTEIDFFNTFKAAHNKIRSLPEGDKALIVGPSIDKFDKLYMERFLNFCVANNIKLDILSWHDFRSGDSLLKLADDLKWAQDNWIKKYPSLRIKKIQLNEIIGPEDQYSPLVPLMYFKALEDGGADASCKACWPNSKGISNCDNNSMDGLVNENNEPRSVWWAYKYYNESTQKRLTSTSSSKDLVSFAYQKRDKSDQVCLLLGNYKNNVPTLTINLRKLKLLSIFKNRKSLKIEYYRIPNTGESVLTEPQLIALANVNITNLTSPSFSFENLKMNEVYLIKIK